MHVPDASDTNGGPVEGIAMDAPEVVAPSAKADQSEPEDDRSRGISEPRPGIRLVAEAHCGDNAKLVMAAMQVSAGLGAFLRPQRIPEFVITKYAHPSSMASIEKLNAMSRLHQVSESVKRFTEIANNCADCLGVQRDGLKVPPHFAHGLGEECARLVAANNEVAARILRMNERVHSVFGVGFRPTEVAAVSLAAATSRCDLGFPALRWVEAMGDQRMQLADTPGAAVLKRMHDATAVASALRAASAWPSIDTFGRWAELQELAKSAGDWNALLQDTLGAQRAVHVTSCAALEDAIKRTASITRLDFPPRVMPVDWLGSSFALDGAQSVGEIDSRYRREPVEDVLSLRGRAPSAQLASAGYQFRGELAALLMLALRAGWTTSDLTHLLTASPPALDASERESADMDRGIARAKRPIARCSVGERVVISDAGGVFEVRFRGETGSFKKLKGLQMLKILTDKPNEYHSCLDLRSATASGPIARSLVGENAAADQRYGLKECQARLSELDEEIEEAVIHGQWDRKEEFEAAKDEFLKDLKRQTGGRAAGKRVPPEVDKARVSVRTVIMYAIENIGEAMPELVDHLRNRVDTGCHCRYRSGG